MNALRLHRVLAGLLLLTLGPLGSLLAQEEGAVPTVEEIEMRLSELEVSESETRAADQESYTEALAALRRAIEYRTRAQNYRSEEAEAPVLLESLHTELATPPDKTVPVVGDEVTMAELETSLRQSESELASASLQVEELQRTVEQRNTRRDTLPADITAAQQAKVTAEEALIAAQGNPEAEAKRARLRSEIDAHEARLEALEAERANIEARREVLPLRLTRAQRRLARAEIVEQTLKGVLASRRQAEAEKAAADARAQLEESLIRSYPELAAIAKRIGELTELRSGEEGFPARLSKTSSELSETWGRHKETQQRFSVARKRVRVAGLKESTGFLLRTDEAWLTRPGELGEQANEIERRLSDALLTQIEVSNEQEENDDLEATLANLLGRIEGDDTSSELRDTARQLLVSYRSAIQSVLRDLEELLPLLAEYGEATAELRQSVRKYRDFIEKRILYVRSAPLNPVPSLVALPRHLTEVLQETAHPGYIESLYSSPRRVPAGFLLLLVAVLLGARRHLWNKRIEMAGLVRSYRTDRYFWTVRALVHSFLLSLPLPLLAWTLGWLLDASTDNIHRAMGSSLCRTALVWLVLRFLSSLTTEKGVGQVHFRWPASSLAVMRRELRWFFPLAVGSGFVVSMMEGRGKPEWSDSIGRTAFLVEMAAMAVFSHRLLSADSGFWFISPRTGKSLLGRTHAIWSLVATGMPIVLGILALLGYYYTVQQFEARMRYSFGFALILVLVNALLLRWLYMTRRRLAVSQALEARAKREEEEEAKAEGHTEAGPTPLDDDKIDIPAVNEKTRELFRSSLTLATVVGLYFLWAGVLPALQGLDRVQLLPEVAILEDHGEDTLVTSQSGAPVQPDPTPVESTDATGSGDLPSFTPPGLPASVEAPAEEGGLGGLPARLTLADVLLALVFLALTTVASKNLPALLELSLLQRLPLDSGSRYAVSTIVRYLIILVGVSAVSGALGIGWQQIQWLAAALTFGLAFGLQEIFANFVSGLIILIERPIRVGDVVTVGGTEGRVTQLRMRATTIQDYDRREYLIPNKEFITGSVINWTLSDPVTRIIVPVGIAYGSDVELARKLLLQCAKDAKLALDDPAPQAIFRSFGESSLDFELRVFLQNRDLWAELTDRLHTRIDRAFRQADIEISFPQRDIHVRTMVKSEAQADS